MILGWLAVLFWSFGSALIYFGARQAGTWRFVAIASLLAGLLGLFFHRLRRGELRRAVCLPWRLWVIPVLAFVVYGLVWPWALAISTPNQVYGVSLINYLWPVLTVVFSSWWVPGTRLTLRILVAMALAVSGLICANAGPIRSLWLSAGSESLPVAAQLLPYALASTAAVTWAVYSAFLARWRVWGKDYVTSPIGFLLVGLVAGAVTMLEGGSRASITPAAASLILLYGAGPLAAGYLLWERALCRARVQALGLIAAATPVLSTLFLCLCLRTVPGPELILAAFLISGGVALSRGD